MSKRPRIFKGKRMKLTNVPEDVQQIIIEKQEDEKDLCLCERNQDYAIYKMLREYHQIMSKDIAVVCSGQISEPEKDIHFGEFWLFLKVPLDSPTGLAINYKRIEQETYNKQAKGNSEAQS